MLAKLLALALLALAAGPFPLDAQQWPQWRGPKLNSVSDETGLPHSFSKTRQRLWRVPLPGPGGASPVVWDDRIFITASDGNEEGARLLLICIGVDGKIRWQRALHGKNKNVRDRANSASPSPFTDGEHVWALMTNGILHCFDMEGQLVWKLDLQKKYGPFDMQFGMTTTPILDNGVIYWTRIDGDRTDKKTTSVGHIIALDAKTGNEIWHHKRLTSAVSECKQAYASPIIYRDKQRAFLIAHGADFVTGHSLVDGTERWRCGLNRPGDNYHPYLRFVASPTWVEGMIVVPTAKRKSVIALKPDLHGEVTDQADPTWWRLPKGTPDVASPLIYQGLVFLAGENGVLTCLDAATGKIEYRKRLFVSNHRATPVGADGNVIICGRDGTIYIVRATKKFELIDQAKLNEEITASPAIANKKIYIRTFDALYAFGAP